MVTKAQRTRTARQPEVIDVDPINVKRTAFFTAQQEYLESLGVPSERRAFAAFAIGITTSMAVGISMTKLTTMAMIGAVLLTGSSFLALLIWVIGTVLAIYASIKTFSAAFDYIASGKIDRDVIAAKEWVDTKAERVRGWFTKAQEKLA